MGRRVADEEDTAVELSNKFASHAVQAFQVAREYKADAAMYRRWVDAAKWWMRMSAAVKEAGL